MREGLYRASFIKADSRNGLPGEEFGRGVAELRGGRIVGGDSVYYYVGHYSLDGSKLDGEVTITPHTEPGPRNLFSHGAVLTLKGTADDVGIRCGGTISTSPGDRVQIGLTWLVE